MPRKGPAPKRAITPDPIHGSPLVTQMVNKIMLDGKRSLSETIVYDAFEIIRQRTGADPIGVFKRAVDNVKPALEVKSRRVGGATYQVPIEVRRGRDVTLALRWITQYSRGRREHTMAERLAGELLDANNNVGAAVKRREDTIKMADANKAFAHYRW
jgi:small subunit ribosomal protein S7